MQDYNSDLAYSRWRGNLARHLRNARESFQCRKGLRLPDFSCWRDRLSINPLTKCGIYAWGRVVWGVFARAFWPIYMPGQNNHYGTVVISFDPFFEDSPALFEISEDLRRLREGRGEPQQLQGFARQIRNDWKVRNRLKIPKELAGGREACFQSIYIPRTRLPCKYLHHRLVPVLAHPRLSYATILPLEHWPAEFQARWQEGEALLSTAQLTAYQQAFPNIRP